WLAAEVQDSGLDLEKKLQEYSQQTGIELARIREFYGDQEKQSRLSYQVTEEKVLEFLVAKSKIKDVPKEELAKDDENK
ncbi:MAG: hypothetical protein V4760_14790, partial [Bdellovibrionota bacterium]